MRRKKKVFQYLLTGVVHCGMYLLVFAVNGWNVVSILYCLMASVLLVLSTIDVRTFEIPSRFPGFITIIGLMRIMLDFENRMEYIIGFFSLSVVLFILWMMSGGKAIGGGDVKLVAACGLVLGWRKIWLAFFIACVMGTVIHLIRMRFFGAAKALAMGPYLSAGVMIAALWGETFL